MVEKIEVPIGAFVHDIAREAALTVIDSHVQTCIMRERVRQNEERICVLEKRFNILIGAVIGSDALGGTVAGVIAKLM